MIKKIVDKYVKDTGINDLKDIPTIADRLLSRCKKYKKVYVFGAGVEAGSCVSLFSEMGKQITGIIVSKGHKRQQDFRGIPIYEIDEIKPYEDEIIIVALNAKNRAEVMPQLTKSGFKNIERYR